MKKSSIVRVVTGRLFAGWMGTIHHIEHQWNMSFAMVSFKGADYPVRLNVDRLQIIAKTQE